jgi:glucosamine 6-phosphate synthetase-like amidotransferase/phosphosugar isomerase protein
MVRVEIIDELISLPANLQAALDSVKPFSLHNAQYLSKGKEIMFLGTGVGEAVAYEGSLKMKELTY